MRCRLIGSILRRHSFCGPRPLLLLCAALAHFVRSPVGVGDLCLNHVNGVTVRSFLGLIILFNASL